MAGDHGERRVFPRRARASPRFSRRLSWAMLASGAPLCFGRSATLAMRRWTSVLFVSWGGLPLQVQGACESSGAGSAPLLTRRSVGSASTGGDAASGPTTSAEDQAQAAALRSEARTAGAASVASEALSSVPAVVIDEGTFKYVLLKVADHAGQQRYLVRGTAGAPYHKDVATPYVRQLLAGGLEVEILGGGRIYHDAEKKIIRIYGFSYGFPWVDGAGHELSAAEIREAFPGYQVEWFDEGY